MNGVTEKKDGFIFETAPFLDGNTSFVNTRNTLII